MGLITSVIVSIEAEDDENPIIQDIQDYVTTRGHIAFSEDQLGGGEKSLTGALLIGSFNYFDTDDFIEFIKRASWFDPSGDTNHIEVIIKEVTREDFPKWKLIL